MPDDAVAAIEFPRINRAIDAVFRPDSLSLGFRSGVDALRAYLASLQSIGVNHVALNLCFNQADIESTLRRLADELLPDFTA